MTRLEFSKVKLIPIAVAIATFGMSSNLFAAPVTFGKITLDATYSLGAGGPNTDGTTPTNPTGSANGADFYLSTGGTNSAFFHTYGFSGPSTYFGARVTGNGVFAAYTRSSFKDVYTNTSTSAQNYVFGFNVVSGGVDLQGNGTGSADLKLRVAKDGTDLARSHTTISQASNSGPSSCVEDDVGVLSAYMACGSSTDSSSNAPGGLFNVDFGLIGAGESFTLDYDIIATISGIAAAATGTHQECHSDGYGGDGGYGGYGGTQICMDVPNVEYFSATARSGDPFGAPLLDANGQFVDDGSNGAALTVNLPEPSALALTGLALAGLAASRRKKRSKVLG